MARLLIFFFIILCTQSVLSRTAFEELIESVRKGTKCVSIYSCPPYMALLQETNPTIRLFLNKSFCGFDGMERPKVLCPINYPPDPELITTTTAPRMVVKSSDDIDSQDYITEFPSPPQCGKSSARFNKIVGGEDAKLGDLPWMALLGYKRGRDISLPEWRCGGSLISEHHVVTAAHCIHHYDESLYIVRLGELDLAREDEGATPIDVLIKRIVKHEDYNSLTFVNDIGLLVLEEDITFTDLIRPICFPTSREMRSLDFVDYMPFIAGWGKTDYRAATATHLQVLQLPVLSEDFCKKAYSVYKLAVDDRVICAGFKQEGGKDSCEGDSGGPLMQPLPVNSTTYFYQIGVISFGLKKCATPGVPGYYTRITAFLPWLERHMLGITN